MKYILILIWVYAGESMYNQQIEIETKELCLEARAIILKDFETVKKVKGGHRYYIAQASCIPKKT